MSRTRQPAPAANPIVRRIDEAIGRLGLSREGASKKAGLDRSFLRKLAKHPTGNASLDALNALAGATGIRVEELMSLGAGEEPGLRGAPNKSGVASFWKSSSEAKDLAAPKPLAAIPIRAVIAAGSIMNAFTVEDRVIGSVERPPGLLTFPDAYALYVDNDSMAPMHRAGELRFVNPSRPAAPGDSVIVYEQADGRTQAFIKLFERRDADWIICRQYKPPSEIKFARNRVVAIHRVLTMNELFNA